MLFRRATLDSVADGKVTLAFRRWKRPTVKAGGRVRTAAGEVRIGGIGTIDAATLTASDAAAAGFPTLDSLHRMLGPENGDPVYRIELEGIAPDARAALRVDAQPTAAEWKAIEARFARWEKEAAGYFPAILAAIAERPGVAAQELAATFNMDKPKFKRDVRKLKELGLTESLDVGYRLSPRGATVLERLRSSTAS
ncbi:ASCH domain-containing protein [Mesorhizobium sp. ZMM04-5]|uniref:ASCH domain-containing protein n=1 Tax=Mesorhizobium marinum TaxID=3228790 RepID=A0ABV3R314_9HYPH